MPEAGHPHVWASLTPGAGSSGLEVALSDRGGRVSYGQVPAGTLAELLTLAELPELPAGVLSPRVEREMATRESAIAEGLVSLLEGLPEVSRHLARLAGRADAEGGALALLVDGRTPAWRALPWELLGGGSAIHPRLQVARLHATAAPRPTVPDAGAPGLEVLLWLPDPREPRCAEVAEALRSLWSGLPRLRPRLLDPDDRVPSDPFLVHVVCHGSLSERAVDFLLQEQLRPAASAAHWLRPFLERSLLVIHDVCHAASGVAPPASVPAWRFLEAGAAACVAPATRLGIRASATFSRGVYLALSEGASLAYAVEEGRRRLRGLAIPRWDSRWWSPCLLVGDAATLERSAPLAARPALAGWPVPHERAVPALRRALDLANKQGFLGVEQLAAALLEEQNHPAVQQAREALREVAGLSVHLWEAPGEEATLTITPSAVEMGSTLPEGFGLDELVLVVGRHPAVEQRLDRPLNVWSEYSAARRDTTEALPAHSPTIANPRDASALVLEVLAGPEGGLRLSLTAPGQTVGRWSFTEGPTLPLFHREGRADGTMHRRHLKYQGDGLLMNLGRTPLGRTIRRTALPVIAPGAYWAPAPGEVITLGQTPLMVVYAPPRVRG